MGYVVLLLSLLAAALMARGFLAIFWEDIYRPPGCYFSWGVVCAIVISVLVDAPTSVSVGNLVILLFTAWMWAYDVKERA